MHDVVLSIASFAVTLVSILLLIPLAQRIGLLDHPDQRKQHDGAVPLVGGLALYIMLMAAFLSGAATSAHTTPLLVAATIVSLVGAIDDRIHISPRVRLLTHFMVALIIVFGAGLRLEHLGTITPNGERLYLGPLATAVTIFGIMSVINAMNFIDGLDGLAGGLALIAVASLWVIFAASDRPTPQLLPLLSGGLAAFMLFNARWFGRKKAAIFLGDAGSTLLGLLLAWMMIEHSQRSDHVVSPVVALWLLAVPLIDFLAIVTRRTAMKRHPFHPDREHLHHILTRTTNNDGNTVAIILIVAIACAVMGILGQLNGWPKNVMFYAFLAIYMASYRLLRHSWKLMKASKAMGLGG